MIDDQHQPAAVAPRLSEDEISEIHRQVRSGYHPGATRELLTELDATRADLARARAERDEAKAMAEQRLKSIGVYTGDWLDLFNAVIEYSDDDIDEDGDYIGEQIVRLAQKIGQQRDQARAEAAALREALETELKIDEQETRGVFGGLPKHQVDWHVRESIRGKRLRKAMSTPQSEQPQQPSAPVDRSAEAEGPARRVCCHCDGTGLERDGSICMSCNGTCCSYHYRAPEPHCRFCKHATAPPDHQAAGDER